MTRLTTVEVGPHTKRDLRADIVAYRGTADADYNGLLGMNFIRGLKYTIDFEHQTIRWEH
jgi:predicted aspartyl protease